MKKIPKLFLMLLIIIIGIGGACFAVKVGDKCTKLARLSAGFKLFCGEKIVAIKISETHHQLQCSYKNPHILGEEPHDYKKGVCVCGDKKGTPKDDIAKVSNEKQGKKIRQECKSELCAPFETTMHYYYTDDWHWKRCDVCNNNVDNSGGSHSPNASGVCKDCGAKVSDKKDTSKNQNKVINGVKGIEYFDDCDKCSKELNHVFYYYYYTDDWHWVTCPNCGNNVDGSGGKHNPGDNGICVCGFVNNGGRPVDKIPTETSVDPSKCSHYDMDNDLICNECNTAITTCYSCQKKLKDGWLDNGIGQHYKECEDGHPSYIINHTPDGNGVCTVCGIGNGAGINDLIPTDPNKCTGCNQEMGIWQDDGRGNHYRSCSCGSMRLEGMHYDMNEDLICEGCSMAITTCYVETCKAKLKDGWQDNGLGQHYKECEAGHPSYIINHTPDANGACTVCHIGNKETINLVDPKSCSHYDKDNDLICNVCNTSITTCYVETCKAKLKEGWQDNRLGQHYKECEKGHPSYILDHTPDSNGMCTVCGIGKSVLDDIGNVQNKCKKCGETISSEWKDDGEGKHYKECKKGHKVNHGMHYDANNDIVCDVCKLPITTCYVETCKAKLKDGWKDNGQGKHYKECEKGHPSYIIPHTVDENGMCTVCGIGTAVLDDIGNVQNKCKKCGETISSEWKDDGEAKHYQSCKNGHKINHGMHYDEDDDIICNVCNLQITTCYVCQKKLKDGWKENGEGKHYKECVNGHPSYIIPHTMDANDVCTVCKLSKDEIRSPSECKECGEKVKSEWKDDGVGKHYRLCPKDHKMNYAMHYDANEDVVCDVCKLPITTCYSCKARLRDGWKDDGKGKHFKLCEAGHSSYILPHTPDTNGVCTVCGIGKNEIKNSIELNSDIATQSKFCSVCQAKVKWVSKESLHVLMCEKDNTHIMQIEGHKLDTNKICTICKFEKKKEYETKFVDFIDKNHWAWNNVGHMAEMGIVEGTLGGGQRYLKPDEHITAEAVIALLARTLGYDGVDKIADGAVYKPIQSEWSEDEWKYLMKYLNDNGKDAKKEMQILLSNNGISGTNEEIKTNYKKAISRERVAYLLGVFFNSVNKKEVLVKHFDDLQFVSASYVENLKLLSSYDIFRGKSNIDGKLYARPTEPITRVEAIALIDRFNTVKELGITYGE